MLLIYATIDMKVPLSPESSKAIREHQDASLTEPGCSGYLFSLDLEKPDRVHVLERWDGEESIKAHMQTSRSIAFATWMKDMARAVKVSRYEVLEDQSDDFTQQSRALMGDTVRS